MHTDAKRLQQVLKNLLSNALKFTEQGSVRLSIDKAAGGWTPNHIRAQPRQAVIAFSVTDTGIGIPSEKQRIIFEAFQQADGTTSRNTAAPVWAFPSAANWRGCWAARSGCRARPEWAARSRCICRKPMLRRRQQPKSEALRITPPCLLEQAAKPCRNPGVDVILPSPSLATEELVEDLVIDDDRNLVQPGDSALLIVEDDITFARILLDLAHERGLKALVASARQQRHVARARVPAGRNHAGHQSSRYGGLDDPRPAEARSGHPAHSRCISFPETKIGVAAWRWAP
jgi:hypothetical protein